jgi:hypothetical protein
MFFNPLIPHCVSQRTLEYATEDVYLTSFYLKNKQIGLNDNRIPITDECEMKSDFMSDYYREEHE